MNNVEIITGDCLAVLKDMADNSVDAVVTDPPYGLGKEPDALAMLRDWMETGHHDVRGAGFMNKAWDAFVPQPALWRECLRVLKPGGHIVAFAGTRTHDLMTLGLRLAGFEIRDTLMWVYGSGFPKSHNVAKAIDKHGERWLHGHDEHPPFSPEAEPWQGWGTALKPALEPITLARKPLAGTVAQNVLAHGTGALNIDACSVSSSTSQRLGGGSEWEDDQCLCASCAANAALNAKPSTQGTRAYTATRRAEQLSSGRDATSRHDTGKPDIGCLDGMTAENTAISSSIVEFGKTQTGLFPPDMTSTMSTATRATTGLRTCSVCGASITRSDTGSIIAETKNSPHDANKHEPTASAARWPANLIHDGSDEVVGLFPTTGRLRRQFVATEIRTRWTGGTTGQTPTGSGGHDDAGGSAARFFYMAHERDDEWLARNLGLLDAITAENSLSLQKAAAAIARAVAASAPCLAGMRFDVSSEHSTTATATELKRLAECVMQTIPNIGPKFLQEWQHTKLSPTGSLVTAAATREPTGIITITVDRWKSNGFAEPVTFSITPESLDHGEVGLRFRYCAKASKRDREEGLEGFSTTTRAGSGALRDGDRETGARANIHPTVKPTDLMRWLCRLITPPGGVILDPFMGSGSTGKAAVLEGFRFVGVEMDPEYVEIAKARIAAANKDNAEND